MRTGLRPGKWMLVAPIGLMEGGIRSNFRWRTALPFRPDFMKLAEGVGRIKEIGECRVGVQHAWGKNQEAHGKGRPRGAESLEGGKR